jgi:hypothetical protein
MKVGFEKGKHWGLYRQKTTKFSCSFIVKAVPVFTAKLLAMDFAIVSF